MAHQRLKDEAEKAKKELSATAETEINLPFITADATGPKHLVKSLTRAKFESMTDDLVSETLEHIKTAMNDAGLDNDEINEVIMVGGSTVSASACSLFSSVLILYNPFIKIFVIF